MAKSSFFNGTGVSTNYVSDLEGITEEAKAHRDASALSAASAASDAQQIAADANVASANAASAQDSATLAANSVADVADSAAQAANSQSAAATSAAQASVSAAAGATSASQAAASEGNASTSETNAATSATSAATYKTNAATSAASASTSASQAAASAASINSSAFATSAQGLLADSAVQTDDSPTFVNISVTGTVDGRDVATDGAKLDGIEAGANVTDTANVTAAGALMTTGGAMTGNLTVSGGLTVPSSSGGITFNNDDGISYSDSTNTFNFNSDGGTANANISVGGLTVDGTDISYISHSDGNEQLRLGYRSGGTDGIDAYLSFYRDGTTRLGYLQALEDRLRLNKDDGTRLDLFSDYLSVTGDLVLESAGTTTGSTRRLTIESVGYAVLDLSGDRSNTSGEPGGAGVALRVDGTSLNAVLSYINTSGEDGIGGSYTGTTGNSVLLGTVTNAPLDFGINGEVQATLAQNGSFSTLGQGTLWGSTNDGSGSGLDADTVDGLHEDTFMRRSANSQLNMNNNDIIGVDQIIHEGDPNTYMQFHAVDRWRVVTGGTERLEIKNSQITSTEPIHAPSFHGDGSALSGIGTATAALAAGAVGSYAWLGSPTSNITMNPGGTFSGSSLRYSGTSSASAYSDNTASRIGFSNPDTPAGTWRAMGGTGAVSRYNTTLFLRIS